MANLTLSQKQTLRAAIEADSALLALAQANEYSQLAAALNANASPDFWAWKTRLPKHDLTDKVSPDATTFDWGTQAGNFIARSQGERDCWRELWNTSLTCDPSNQRVRDAMANIFSGTGAGAVNNRTHFLSMARRLVNRMERVFATGTGSTASPGDFVVEGTLAAQEMASILSA